MYILLKKRLLILRNPSLSKVRPRLKIEERYLLVLAGALTAIEECFDPLFIELLDFKIIA